MVRENSELNAHLRLIFDKVSQNCPMSRESAGPPMRLAHRFGRLPVWQCLLYARLQCLHAPSEGRVGRSRQYL
jgi:hypothetical protein